MKEKNSANSFVWNFIITIGCLITMLAVFVFFAIKVENKLAVTKPLNQPTPKVVAPSIVKVSLVRLQENVGTIEEQRRDIDRISKALNDGTATSESLCQEGFWLHEIRQQVDIREALIFWQKIKEAEAEHMGKDKVPHDELLKIMLWAKKISPCIGSPYAKDGGLRVSHGQLYETVLHLQNGGKDPH